MIRTFTSLKKLWVLPLVATLALHAQKPGINLSYIDSSASPAQDFYNFCNGKWQKSFTLRPSDARYGTFNEINDNNLVKIKAIYANSAKAKAAPGSNVQRMRDFYLTALDSAKADQLGMKPIEEQLKKIDAVKNLDEMLALKAEFDKIGVVLFFDAYVSPDQKNSRKNRFYIEQGGLGLGDKDYYFSEKYFDIRKKYKNYMAQLLESVGETKLAAFDIAEDIFEFEKKLANDALSRVETRDLVKRYNIFTPKTLRDLVPVIKWEAYFAGLGTRQPDTVIVAMTEYMRSMGAIVSSEVVGKLKYYAKLRLLMKAAPYLSARFVEIDFDFRGRVMSGAPRMKPRWERVHYTMDGLIGDILSEEFVKKHFPAEAKVKVNKLIDNLILSYRDRIASRDWMSAEAKKAANLKLDLLIRKIGYPEKWKNYNGLEIKTDSYWANYCRAAAFQTKENIGDLYKPVDRNKWQMTPVTVNAYYDPSTNEITFPAAILQPPFYDPKADDAANYGTIGSVIGHELSHGFDDQGSQFDAYGNMVMWWTEKDLENFKARTAKIIEQFNAYSPLDSMSVNGEMTQGENIADLGGVTLSYYAYKKSLNGAKSKSIGGLTGEQRFFIAWAQGWKSSTRKEELKRLLTIDFHAPAYYRAYAPLTNMKEFYDAFGVKPGDKMFRPEEKRVEIW